MIEWVDDLRSTPQHDYQQVLKLPVHVGYRNGIVGTEATYSTCGRTRPTVSILFSIGSSVVVIQLTGDVSVMP